MEYIIAIIVSLIALVGAGFAFLRANSSHHILSKRIETLKEKNNLLEARLRRVEGNTGRGNRPANEGNESGRRNQSRSEQQEARQSQPRQEQQEPRQKQPRPEQQEQRQRQRERQQQQQVSPDVPQNQETGQQPQQKRRKENRRRNEPTERAHYGDLEREQQAPVAKSIKLEIQDSDLLSELEQAAGNTTPAAAPANVPVEAPYGGKKYAIIPEDGVIRQHQLQQQPDSDSYIEVDPAADGSSNTRYRFNLAGNHAFVIAQGIDRLENAFDFEKPLNRMVTKVVQQEDGVLAKVNNGWKIVEKARIDFR